MILFIPSFKFEVCFFFVFQERFNISDGSECAEEGSGSSGESLESVEGSEALEAPQTTTEAQSPPRPKNMTPTSPTASPSVDKRASAAASTSSSQPLCGEPTGEVTATLCISSTMICCRCGRSFLGCLYLYRGMSISV